MSEKFTPSPTKIIPVLYAGSIVKVPMNRKKRRQLKIR